MSRWILFLITVALGIGAGLYYGWRINPVKSVDATPATLRDDYKTDYVLMVAESYQVEKDLDLAVQRLSYLGSQDPVEITANAIRYGATIEPPYADGDLALMRSFYEDLQQYKPVPETQSQ
jgi:hypothetical protein